ncbi:MAG: hypothetical protein WCK02_03650 [Bacteroidota bacterium]
MKSLSKSILVIIFFAIIAYDNPVIPNTNDEISNKESTLDTTVLVKGVFPSKYRGPNLSLKLAKKILYEYFNKKGIYNSDNIPSIIEDSDTSALSVDFDTIYKVNLNGNKFEDAIITYWLALPYSSGHCLQPLRAVIIDTDNGYTITNEEFIPDRYIIDSVKNSSSGNYIYGYDYECANDKVLRKLRIKIIKLYSINKSL